MPTLYHEAYNATGYFREMNEGFKNEVGWRGGDFGEGG